jgi:hypothetical protein
VMGLWEDDWLPQGKEDIIWAYGRMTDCHREISLWDGLMWGWLIATGKYYPGMGLLTPTVNFFAYLSWMIMCPRVLSLGTCHLLYIHIYIFQPSSQELPKGLKPHLYMFLTRSWPRVVTLVPVDGQTWLLRTMKVSNYVKFEKSCS